MFDKFDDYINNHKFAMWLLLTLVVFVIFGAIAGLVILLVLLPLWITIPFIFLCGSAAIAAMIAFD